MMLLVCVLSNYRSIFQEGRNFYMESLVSLRMIHQAIFHHLLSLILPWDSRKISMRDSMLGLWEEVWLMFSAAIKRVVLRPIRMVHQPCQPRLLMLMEIQDS